MIACRKWTAMKALLQYKAAALHTVQPRGLSIDEQLISALTAFCRAFFVTRAYRCLAL